MIRVSLAVVEIVILSALVFATRCANYQDVFVAGNVHFVDADCYARMTRVRMCATRPGLILRHHDFENFPQGTTPHTTAPLDYLILALALLFKPFTTQPLEVAGAFVSPLLALAAAWFLWWWSRQMKFRYGWVMLILFAISPILVHGTALGRPDHQSLLILLVTIAICAEWTLQNLQVTGWLTSSKADGGLETAAPCSQDDAIRESRIACRRSIVLGCVPAATAARLPYHVESGMQAWSLTSAVAWALAIWVSLYEPLILFVMMIATTFLVNRPALFARERRAGWILFAVIILAAILIERHAPSVALFQSNPFFRNWVRTIGELAHVSPANSIWLRWCGYLVLLAPFLVWMSVRARKDGAQGLHALPVYVLLIAAYFLTIWQVRWAYFFVLIFALALPALLAPIKSGLAVWIAFLLSIFPILGDWDERLWPNETQLANRVEKRIELAQIRDLALSLRSSGVSPFLAPWWLSPSIAYWSGQPGVAGSSHESLKGIEDSARFFLSYDQQQARSILHKDNVAWVFAYDSQPVTQNSAAVLNAAIPPYPLCRVLDRTPSQAPEFMIFSAQMPVCKLYRVNIQR